MRLNLGSHIWNQPGWINIDLRSYESPSGVVAPDIFHDIRKPFPFDPGSVDAVYCGHILEHIELSEVPTVLDNIRRVLKPGGMLGVVGPCLELARAGYPSAIIENGFKGGPEGCAHLWHPTAQSTRELLESDDWAVTEFDILTMPDSWPLVSRVGWQCAFECTDARPKKSPAKKPAKRIRTDHTVRTV